jgi:PAS domain S-box-containing protein
LIKPFRDLSIRHKLIRMNMLVSTAVLLLATLAFIVYELVTFRATLAENLATQAEIVAINTVSALLFNDPAAAGETVAALRVKPNVHSAAVYTADGRLFAKYLRSGEEGAFKMPESLSETAGGYRFGPGVLFLFRPVFSNGDRVGMVAIQSDLEEMNARVKRYAGIVAGVLAISLLTAYRVSSRIQGMISKPLLNLAETAKSVSERKDYSVRAVTANRDEIGQLVETFNEMLSQIEARNEALQRTHEELEERVAERTRELEEEVAERKQAELEQRKQAQLLDLANDAITLRDLKGETIIYWNQGAERLYGWSADEAKGSVIHDLLRTVFPRPLKEILAEFVREGHWEGEVVHTKKDGSAMTVLSRWALLRDPQGAPIGSLEINSDITPRKQAEERLRRAEAFLNSIVENIPNMIFVKEARELRFVRFNKAGEALLGYTEQELIGKNDNDFFPKEQADFFTAKDRQVLDDGLLVDIPEEPIETRHLGRRLLHTKKIPVYDERGKPVYLLGISEDITERRQKEEALRVSEERIRLMVEGVKDYAILMLDLGGHIVSWNAGAERIKGYRAEEIIGRHFSHFYPLEGVAAGESEEALRVAADEGRFEDEGWRLRKDRSRFWANVVITPIRDEKGDLKGFSKVTRDLTERKRGEEETQFLNARLEAANKELEAFSYSVSHDLRAPLRHINGFVEMLKEHQGERLDEKSRHYMKTIANSAKKMGDLIDDLLVFSRMAKTEMRIGKVSSDQLVEEVIRDLEPEVQGRKISWTIGRLPEVQGDAAMLRQVWANLIGNAIKYTRTREQAEIEIGSRLEGREQLFFARDNGVGFDPQYAGKLFGVFQRLHRADEFEGTGIGLANVRRIVQRHGGRTWAEGRLDHGAIFYFSLPNGGEERGKEDE